MSLYRVTRLEYALEHEDPLADARASTEHEFKLAEVVAADEAGNMRKAARIDQRER